MKWIALIPAYEPDGTLKNIVSELIEHSFSVVVVDDGSGEEYRHVFEELKGLASVISYEPNHGKGYALKEGLKYICEKEKNSVTVTMDADGQHLVSDAEKLCAEVEKNSADMIIGSRIIPKDAPTKSRLGNGITRKVFRTVTGVKVYDTQSGLRAFRSEMIPFMLEIPGDRYEYEMNVLLTMAKQKKSIKELPIQTIYFDKQNSVSHFNAVKDSFKIYAEIFKFVGSSLLSFIIDYCLYSLLLMLGCQILFSNIGARAISSCINFAVNKKMVFRSEGSLAKEAAKYFSLVIFNLCINSVILTLLTKFGINAFIAKIAVELIMFIFSYLIQRSFIFRKRTQN